MFLSVTVCFLLARDPSDPSTEDPGKGGGRMKRVKWVAGSECGGCGGGGLAEDGAMGGKECVKAKCLDKYCALVFVLHQIQSGGLERLPSCCIAGDSKSAPYETRKIRGAKREENIPEMSCTVQDDGMPDKKKEQKQKERKKTKRDMLS